MTTCVNSTESGISISEECKACSVSVEQDEQGELTCVTVEDAQEDDEIECDDIGERFEGVCNVLIDKLFNVFDTV